MNKLTDFKVGDLVKLNCDYANGKTGDIFTINSIDDDIFRVTRKIGHYNLSAFYWRFDKVKNNHPNTEIFK